MVFVFSCVFSGPMGDLSMYRAAVAAPGGFYSSFCVFAPVFLPRSDCYTGMFDMVSVFSLC